MSWRAGTQLFWDIWPQIQQAIPDPEHRADLTRGMLRLFLENDTDPGDLRHRDAEIDRLMDEVDPER